MKSISTIATELSVAGRLAGRALRRRFSTQQAPAPDVAAFRRHFKALLARLPPGLVERTEFIDLPASRPPWTDSGWDLRTGDAVTHFSCGRTWLSRALDVWVEPHFQLWCRLGDSEVFRGTRSSHSYTADRDGRLQLASYFPGEWAKPDGSLGTPEADYRKIAGSIRVLLIRWCDGVSAEDGLAALVAAGDCDGCAAAELSRLRQPDPQPQGWSHLWFLGPSEIYRRCDDHGRDGAICCRTERDVAILQHEAPFALTPDTRLSWSWKVDALPSTLREDTIPTHDYLSIAVEFDNGQDLTYLWSAQLPVGHHFRCPLPTWKARETHWVVRSGESKLGQWLEESRNIFDDYRIAVGGPMPTRVVGVWLISVSLFQRGVGRCAYAGIRLDSNGETLAIR